MRTTLKTLKKSVIDADRAAKAKLVQKVNHHCFQALSSVGRTS